MITGLIEVIEDHPTEQRLVAWDIHTGIPVAELGSAGSYEDYRNFFGQVFYSPDGHTIAAAHGAGEIRFWNSENGTPLPPLLVSDWLYVLNLRFLNEGQQIAVVSTDGYGEEYSVEIWDLDTRTAQAQLSYIVGMESGGGIAVSPDGNFIAFDDGVGSIRLWDVNQNTEIGVLGGDIQPITHPSEVTHIEFSPDGSTLGAMGGIYGLYLWDVESGRQIGRFSFSHWARRIPFSPDSRFVLVSSLEAGQAHSIGVLDIASGTEVGTVAGGTLLVSSSAYHPDGTLFATGSWDGSVRVYNASTLQQQYVLTQDAYVNDVAFSPDGRFLAVGVGDIDISSTDPGSVTVWNAETGAQVASYATERIVSSLAFSANSRYLTFQSSKRQETDLQSNIWFLDLEASTPPQQLGVGLQNHILCSTDPDSRLLAATYQNMMQIWDLETGMVVREFIFTQTTERPVPAITFSRDCDLIAVGEYSGSVRLLNILDGTEVTSLDVGVAPVESVSFNDDGTLLAAATWIGEIRIWHVSH